jgi:hypothetical protein
LSFTPDTEWGKKAEQLLGAICPGHATWQVEAGRVILLEGDGTELALRMIITQRDDYTAEKLIKMAEHIKKAYGSDGVTRFDTRGLTPSDVVRRVAEIIHLEPYTNICDLHARLEDIKKGTVDASA